MGTVDPRQRPPIYFADEWSLNLFQLGNGDGRLQGIRRVGCGNALVPLDQCDRHHRSHRHGTCRPLRRYSRPVRGGKGDALRAYTASFLSGEPQQYVGHNPLARIGVALLFLFLLIQVVTGLVIAGTDLFWPPFGHLFAAWVAAPGIDPTLVVPGATDLIDKTSYDSMRVFRRPFVEVHEFGFYALAVLIVVHLIAVVTTEIHEGGSITSAMFTGRKILSRRPPDAS